MQFVPQFPNPSAALYEAGRPLDPGPAMMPLGVPSQAPLNHGLSLGLGLSSGVGVGSSSCPPASTPSSLLLSPLATPSPSTFCSKCGAVRTDVRFSCCGASLHARCVFPWPRKECPVCRRPVQSVQILPLEPFYRNGERVEVDEKPTKLRAGRWLEAELNLAETVMKGFNSGMLPLEDGTRLGNFICDLLQCTSARLSSKLRTGKKCFKYCRDAMEADKVLEYEQQQRHLSKQEELFLHYLTKEEAALASRYLQLEWRAQFLGLADKLGQAIDDRATWVTLLKEQHRLPTDLASQASSGSNGSASSQPFASHPQPPSSQDTAAAAAAAAPKAPPSPSSRQKLLAMLVQMMIDRRLKFTAGQKTLSDLLQVLQQVSDTDCCMLARANNWAVLFVSAGLRRLLGYDHQGGEEHLLGVNLIGAKGAILHPGDARPVDLARQHSLREINRLMDGMGNPQTSLMNCHINVFPLTLRMRGRGDVYIQHVMSLLATDDFVLLHASGAPPKGAPSPLDAYASASATVPAMLRTNGVGYAPMVPSPSAPPLGGMLKRLRDFDDMDHLQNDQRPQGRFRGGSGSGVDTSGGLGGGPSSSSANEVMNGVAGGLDPGDVAQGIGDIAMAFMSEFFGNNGHAASAFDADEDDLQKSDGGGYGDSAMSVASSNSGSSSASMMTASTANAMVPQQGSAPRSPVTYRDNYDLYYSPPASFEQTMHNFLRHLPFEAVDIWVPVYDQKSGICQLHFGGGAAVNPELQQWVYYSKNFHFSPNQGVPGRVFVTGNPEFRDDVALLDNDTFLRRDGAQVVGVHTTYGVPIVQPDMHNVLVLVFYSRRQRVTITTALQEFIRRSTASWRIATTVLTNGT